MLNNVRLSKLEIKKRLLEKLNTISGNQAEQESQIMISYSAKKENYIDVKDSEIDKDLINFDLLTNDEKSYLWKYNLDIYTKLHKYLNPSEKRWLATFIQ